MSASPSRRPALRINWGEVTTMVAAIVSRHGLVRCATRDWPRQAVPSFSAARTINPIVQAKPPIQTRLRMDAIAAM